LQEGDLFAKKAKLAAMLTSIEYLVPFLHVRELDPMAEFFAKLGFREAWRMGEPTHRVMLVFGPRDEHVIHLLRIENAADSGARLYLQVPDVDAVQGCVEKGLNVTDLADRDYGMRDFDVTGPEGLIIGIGSVPQHD
jgi:hypothetical protein